MTPGGVENGAIELAVLKIPYISGSQTVVRELFLVARGGISFLYIKV